MSLSSASAAQRRARLGVERLEDRMNPVFLTQPPGLTGALPGFSTFNGVSQQFGGLSIAGGDLYPDNLFNQQAIPFVENEFVLGFGPGPVAQVVIVGRAGNVRNAFTPVPGFTGGINVAVGDVLGDSQAEIIVTPASNAPPFVAVYTPQGRLLSAFLVFSPVYTGGLNVAVGNVLGGIGAGGFNGGFTTEFADAFQLASGGTRPTNQFKQEIIVGTATLSSRVVVTDGSGTILRDFFAFDPLYTGGVNVAAASVDKRRDTNFNFQTGQQDTASYDEIIAGASSFAPLVRVYSTWEGGANLEQNFFAYPPLIGSGVTVTAGPTDGVIGSEIYANLIGTSAIRAIDGETNEVITETAVYPPQFSRVLNMSTAFYFGFGFTPAPSSPLGTTVPSQAAFLPIDDSSTFFFFGLTTNPFFALQDLGVVAGDGPFFQQPRIFSGGFLPAPLNGP